MIEETLLKEWIANPKLITLEIGQMLAEGYLRMQRNTAHIFIFAPQFFDVADNKYATPEDTAITPEKMRGWMVDKTVNADTYVVFGNRMLPQDKPVSNPPVVAPPPAPKKWISNQMVVNAFYEVYGGDKAWEEMKLALGAELRDRMVASESDRIATFTALEKLPRDVNNLLGI